MEIAEKTLNVHMMLHLPEAKKNEFWEKIGQELNISWLVEKEKWSFAL